MSGNKASAQELVHREFELMSLSKIKVGRSLADPIRLSYNRTGLLYLKSQKSRL